MEKTKEITLTLEKAREYYNSGNEELKTISLTFYDEKDLIIINYYDICQKLYKKYATWGIIEPYIDKNTDKYSNRLDLNYLSHCNIYCSGIEAYYSSHDATFLKHIGVLIKVKNLADYFNNFEECTYGCEIYAPGAYMNKHSPSMILFKNSADAKTAYTYLTEEDKKYLNY